jgi:hypothetical protein
VRSRPFGFDFEGRTALDIAQSKRSIGDAKYRVLDCDDGPRGFFVGRFICSCNSLSDRRGPI